MEKLIKKMKKHERDSLLPLYQEHSKYLLRVIKTLNDTDDQFNVRTWLKQIPTFTRVATCHEIAINQYSSIELETHNNHRGKESEYTSHSKAKNVSRDLRVRIIWKIIEKELNEDIHLSKYKTYKNLMIESNETQFVCPYCDNVFLVRERVLQGYHADHTEDFRYDYSPQGQCEHFVMTGHPEDNEYGTMEFEYMYSEFDEYGKEMTDYLDYKCIEADIGYNASYYYFVKDIDKTIEELKNKLIEIKKDEE